MKSLGPIYLRIKRVIVLLDTFLGIRFVTSQNVCVQLGRDFPQQFVKVVLLIYVLGSSSESRTAGHLPHCGQSCSGLVGLHFVALSALPFFDKRLPKNFHFIPLFKKEMLYFYFRCAHVSESECAHCPQR